MTRRLIYGEITADEVVAADTANVLQDSGLANSGRLSHGSCWGNEIGWTQAGAVQDTWYPISDADMSDGQLADVTHDGSGKLTVTFAGKYLVSYSASLECSALNKHVQTGIGVTPDGDAIAIQNDGMQHYDVATPNAQLTQGSTAILDLAALDAVQIVIRTTDTGTPDLSVDHLNISVVRLGV